MLQVVNIHFFQLPFSFSYAKVNEDSASAPCSIKTSCSVMLSCLGWYCLCFLQGFCCSFSLLSYNTVGYGVYCEEIDEDWCHLVSNTRTHEKIYSQKMPRCKNVKKRELQRFKLHIANNCVFGFKKRWNYSILSYLWFMLLLLDKHFFWSSFLVFQWYFGIRWWSLQRELRLNVANMHDKYQARAATLELVAWRPKLFKDKRAVALSDLWSIWQVMRTQNYCPLHRYS